MCPLLAQLKIGFFSSFSDAAVYSTNEANKAGLKQSIIFRCLWYSYSWFQTSQTGGQWYSDTSPFGIHLVGYHCMGGRLIGINTLSNVFNEKFFFIVVSLSNALFVENSANSLVIFKGFAKFLGAIFHTRKCTFGTGLASSTQTVESLRIPLGSISSTFYEKLLHQNPFAKKLQTQIVST